TIVTYADVLKKGSSGTAVKEVQTQLKKKGYFSGDVTGYFGSLTEAAVKKFQTKSKLKADGIVGTSTRQKLLGTTGTSSRGVEMLDWWTSASKIFKIGSKAKVTDVRTGKTFNIVRTYGSNHADCEALTAADAKIIKQIWGGSWSWSRRPVIVETGGRKIAASIAAMPHAGVDGAPANKVVSSRSGGYSRGANLDKIKNNGMSGVIDVHFLNSRTHGTDRVDPKHQAAIREAAKK
ncbi:MAG: peptidoglycan-binding domain-containing protein, partial [Caulobacteraceae bacterium]